MKLTLLTNPNPNTQEKMRFFADYFLFANEYLGHLPELPFDNPFSILDKIRFQMDNNLVHAASYIPLYMKQLFTFYPTTSDKLEIKALEILYKQFTSCDDKKQWLLEHQEFYYEIKKLHSEYEEKLFDNNFTSLFSYLKCNHRLEKHKENIMSSIQILVSQFRLNGYSKTHLASSIERILSRDKFPFPSSILKIADVEERARAEEDFLNNRDLERQFYGLKNLLERPQYQKGYFIYIIEGCSLEEEVKESFKVEFDKITFISPHHLTLKKFRNRVKKTDKGFFKAYPIFFGKNNLLAIVNLNYDDVEHAKETGLRLVIRELQQFNLYLNSELTLNQKHYLFSTELISVDGGRLSGLKKKVKHIRKDDYEYLQKNVYEVLKSADGDAKKQILHNEDVFFRAISDGGVAGYWQYIENLFWTAGIKKSKIFRKFSRLLLIQLEEMRENFISKVNLLVQPFAFNYREVGLEEDDLFVSLNSNFKTWKKDFNIVSVEDKIKSPFLSYAISYYKNFSSESQRIKWDKCFQSLIQELYDYRNSELHTGKVNAFTKIKLEEIIPSILNKARWTIVYACQKHGNCSFKELMNLLVNSDNWQSELVEVAKRAKC